ncbi:EAL domain-containing protein [Rhizobium sp. G21]|nr:EAL domain-containing protein [Rhizobium sp. G21]
MSDGAADSTRRRRRLLGFLSLHYVPALVAIVAMVGILVYADWLHQSSAYQQKRLASLDRLNQIASRLDSDIRGNLHLMRGLVATIEALPAMQQAQFSEIAAQVIQGQSQIINVAAAPGLVVRMVHPYAPNTAVIGLDYMKLPSQRDAVLTARDSGAPVITGPVKLVQGGEALIIRLPVFLPMENGRREFWGILSSVVNLAALYERSGLLDAQNTDRLAIGARTEDGLQLDHFFGDETLLSADRVSVTLDVGRETWIISAAPKSGFGLSLADVWLFRLQLLLAETIVVLPMVWAGRLMQERQRNLVAIHEREEAMRLLSRRLQVALETSQIGVWEFDPAANLLVWDERMKVLYGLPPDARTATYEDWKDTLHPADFAQAQREFTEVVTNGGEYRSEFRVVGKDGAIRFIRAIGNAYLDGKGRKKIVGVNWDVTQDIRLQADLRRAKRQAEDQHRELEKAHLRMENAALHDALTGLPNRRYLDQILADMEDAGGEMDVTVLHIDLDRFKDINDTLGHAAGDVILKHAAQALKLNVRGSDFVARIGGDEFVVVSRMPGSAEEHSDMASRLVEALSKPVDYEGHECRVGASIGIASRTDASEPVEQLLVDADIALYEAKRRGRNRVERFNETLRLNAVHTKKTADDILRGLEQNEFISFFQPQFDAATLEVVGLEALARWDHPVKGLLGADAFLKIAENLKVLAAIDEIILNQALMQLNRLKLAGMPVQKVSVNISAQRLREEGLIERLAALPILPGSLSFELLESISFDGHDGELVPQIEKIRALGIDIEIDDFGTGYASIVTLLKLTPRRLKIDRQLIQPIVESKAQQQLVRSIIDIGRSRGIEIVAEGVETMEHADILRDLGCHYLQGYALARPMSPADLLPFLKARSWMPLQRLDEVG